MQLPQIKNELDQSMETLNELSKTLPTTQSQVLDIQVAYDSGRTKVRSTAHLTAYSYNDFSSRLSGANTHL